MFIITRINDGKTFETEDYKFVVFHSDGRGKELQEKIEVGTSLVLPPYNAFYSWMTSEIVEVVKDEPGLIEFNTRNSNYTITWKN